MITEGEKMTLPDHGIPHPLACPNCGMRRAWKRMRDLTGRVVQLLQCPNCGYNRNPKEDMNFAYDGDGWSIDGGK